MDSLEERKELEIDSKEVERLLKDREIELEILEMESRELDIAQFKYRIGINNKISFLLSIQNLHKIFSKTKVE